MTLWFNAGDPVSIHTLAAAAQEVYSCLAGDKAYLKSFIQASLPEAHSVQNFCKHGPDRNGPKSVRLATRTTELLMLDSVISHEAINGDGTHLMGVYVKRLKQEIPFLDIHLLKAGTEVGINVDHLADRSRSEFLKAFQGSVP